MQSGFEQMAISAKILNKLIAWSCQMAQRGLGWPWDCSQRWRFNNKNLFAWKSKGCSSNNIWISRKRKLSQKRLLFHCQLSQKLSIYLDKIFMHPNRDWMNYTSHEQMLGMELHIFPIISLLLTLLLLFFIFKDLGFQNVLGGCFSLWSSTEFKDQS